MGGEEEAGSMVRGERLPRYEGAKEEGKARGKRGRCIHSCSSSDGLCVRG